MDEFVEDQCRAMNDRVGNLKGYDCGECKNKGVVYVIQDRDIRVRECKCAGIRKDIRRIRESRLGESLNRCTFETFNTGTKLQNRMKELALQFTDEVKSGKGKWLFAGGQPGAGKTHLCTAITGYLLRSGMRARYMLWNAEAIKIKACITESRDYDSLVEPLKNCNVLYIDDFFKSVRDEKNELKNPSPADIRLAFEIINHRYNQSDSVTIISSELRLDEIIAIDEAIGSRIFERAQGYILNIPYKKEYNYRLRKDE